jgi:hypothetical protein
MTLTATSWSGKTLMSLLICLVAIATSDDFWSIAMANPSSELLVIADDDETDRSAERMPACASGGADYTDLHWFVRSATEIRYPAQPKNGPVRRSRPFGARLGGCGHTLELTNDFIA